MDTISLATQKGFQVYSMYHPSVHPVQMAETREGLITVLENTIAYREDIWRVMTENEKCFVVAHEIAHVEQDHLNSKCPLDGIEKEIEADRHAAEMVGNCDVGIAMLVKTVHFVARDRQMSFEQAQSKWLENPDSIIYQRLQALSQHSRKGKS